jgi:hypothetical protein
MNTQYELTRQRLPLPQGCVIARYVDGMREVAIYDIAWDRYRCRHDWIDEDGAARTYFKNAAEDAEFATIDALIAQRRQEANQLRRPTPDHHPV